MEKDIYFQIKELYNTLDGIYWDLSQARSMTETLEHNISKREEKMIKDVNSLRRELKRDGLYSEELETFLDNYMRYYNK